MHEQVNATPHAILLVGIPGSGKSTLAQHLAKQGKGWQVISTDTIRAQLFGDEAVQGAWTKIEQELGRSLHYAAQQAIAGQIEGAIYDATNAVRRNRRRAIAQIHRCGFSRITAIWLDLPLEVCLHRNISRDRQVPQTVIERMHRCLQSAPPGLSEGIDRILHYRGFW